MTVTTTPPDSPACWPPAPDTATVCACGEPMVQTRRSAYCQRTVLRYLALYGDDLRITQTPTPEKP